MMRIIHDPDAVLTFATTTLAPALLLQDRAHTLSLLDLIFAVVVGRLRLGVIVLERIQTSSGDLRCGGGCGAKS